MRRSLTEGYALDLCTASIAGSPVRPYEYRYLLKYPVFPVEVLSEALELWPSRRGDRHYEVAVQLHNLVAVQHGLSRPKSSESMP
jgi:hypothetical protein